MKFKILSKKSWQAAQLGGIQFWCQKDICWQNISARNVFYALSPSIVMILTVGFRDI